MELIGCTVLDVYPSFIFSYYVFIHSSKEYFQSGYLFSSSKLCQEESIDSSCFVEP